MVVFHKKRTLWLIMKAVLTLVLGAAITGTWTAYVSSRHMKSNREIVLVKSEAWRVVAVCAAKASYISLLPDISKALHFSGSDFHILFCQQGSGTATPSQSCR